MPPQRGHDYFTELPLELLQEIASHLPLYHKLKLRTILKKQQENIVVELLGNGIKNLYVSPTTASLDRFTKICESSFFQQNVKEICFLPFVIVPTGLLQRSTFSEYRDAFPQFSEAEALMSFAMYNSVVDQHQAESDDQPQPQSNLVDIVDILEAGIIKMTQVETVSVQLITQEDGMNGFALHHGKWYHNSNMFKSSPPSKALNDIKTAAMKTAAKLPVIRHIERFLQAVRNSGINFRHLALGRHTLGQYHKAQLPFSIQHIGGLTVETTTSVLSNVTELTISCENSKPFYNEEMVRFWQKVAVSATNIKQLTIFPYASSKSTNWVVPGTGIEVIDQFL
ncbi:hypothetical protein HII31_10717 [Pseudocercospora fuligena]|uniref:F-box domain-containing protein n=1 Tax=Pseudocercospora fuligena TaxID=685502 RepID=A0A8H6RC31_9PEZI|nr:hypothetical protein HII31_10717 [Pseudocercospora fuligena]